MQKNHEHSNDAKIKTLLGGASVDIYPEQVESDSPTPAVADVFLDGYGAMRDVVQDTQPGRRVRIIDLRGAPKDSNGGYVYEGQSIGSPFLAIDPVQLDWGNSKGYKGIWADEPVSFGRAQHMDRFDMTDGDISNTHFSVLFDSKQGTLRIVDGGVDGRPSTNGTTVSTANLNKTQEYTYDITPRLPQQNHFETTGRTLDAKAEIIDTDVVAQLANEMRLSLMTPAITKEALSIGSSEKQLDGGVFEPYIGLSIEGRQFLFSKLAARGSGERKYAVCYSRDESEQPVPYMCYKSKSDGGWRISPYIYGGHYSKGEIDVRDSSGARIEYGQYVQATKPDESIAAILEEMEKHPDEMELAVGSDVVDDLIDTLAKENYQYSNVKSQFDQVVEPIAIGGNGLMAYVSGIGFSKRMTPEAARGQIEAMELPDGFEPNFANANADRQYRMEHTLLGATTVDVFQVNYGGRTYEWHVATDDRTNTVWLDRLCDRDSPVTQYGVKRDLILAGALNAKPTDYASQTHGMIEGVDYDQLDGAYVSVKRTLDRYPWVKRYRASRRTDRGGGAARVSFSGHSPASSSSRMVKGPVYTQDGVLDGIPIWE